MAAIYLLLFFLVQCQCLGPKGPVVEPKYEKYIKKIIVSPYVAMYEAAGLFGKSFGICISTILKDVFAMQVQCHTAFQNKGDPEFKTRSDWKNTTKMTPEQVNAVYRNRLKSLVGLDGTGVKIQEFKGKELKAKRLL